MNLESSVQIKKGLAEQEKGLCHINKKVTEILEDIIRTNSKVASKTTGSKFVGGIILYQQWH